METTVDMISALSEAFGKTGYSAEPVRQQAMEMLLKKGLPTSKTEEYRFSPVVRKLEGRLGFNRPLASTTINLPDLISGTPCSKVVFVNGVFSPADSNMLDAGLVLSVETLPAPRTEQDPFDLLNIAFAPGAVHVHVPDDTEVKHPVAIVHYFNNPDFVFANPRLFMNVGARSAVTVFEYTLIDNETPFFNNKQSSMQVQNHASLEYVTFQKGGRHEVTVNNAVVSLADKAKVMTYVCTLEGLLIRNNLTLVLDGEGIDAHLHGLYLVSESNLVDNHTVVDHRKPNSFSNQLYKGVMDGNGKAVFNGKIFVRPNAQKTNAFQSNRNILLSESATVHTKPQLEIWADDVKCSHGCTTGQLDEEALFYLRSRGIPKDTARGLLLSAFGSETLEGIHHEAIRAYVESQIQAKLHPADAV